MMAFTADDFTELIRLGTLAPDVQAMAAAAREEWSGLRVTVVDALDVRGETPALETPVANVFLMESDGHCWSMTADPAAAAGLVLAARS
ncbi:hypothetical protein [Zoogloea sp.]|jgi:hypothetical protein|uniref:hypothetical protein n=1 Tax=Zoogloea sp. TaxID=49181 RepID=UPI002D1FB970|nr:hypothetical protein [Zoogloea sp.]